MTISLPYPRSAQIAIGAVIVVLMTLPFAHSVAVRNIALAVALVAAIAARKTLAVPRLPFLILFAVWAGLGAVSLLWAVDPAYSRGELKTELLYPFLVFALVYSVSVDLRVLALFGIAVVSALLLSLLGAVANFADPDFATKILLYSGAVSYSTWLITIYPFALAALVTPTLAPRWRTVAAMVAVGVLVAGTLTLNRAFVVAFMTATLAVLIWSALRGKARWLPVAASVVALAALMAILFLVVQARKTGIIGIAKEPMTTVRQDVRWRLWETAVAQIITDPWRGVGYGRGAMRRKLAEEFSGNADLWHAHNVVLDYGMQMGLPGIGLILAIFSAALWRLRRAYATADDEVKPLIAAAIVMVVCVLLKNQSDDQFIRHTALAYWAALGAVLGVSARRLRRHSEPLPRKPTTPASVPVAHGSTS